MTGTDENSKDDHSGGSGPDDDRVLAAEYALGLLGAEETAAFETRLSREENLRAMYVAWEEDFVALTDAIAQVAPPVGVLQNVQTQLFGAPEKAPGIWARLGFGRIVLGGMLATALALFVVLQTGVLTPSAPDLRAEIAAEDASLTVLAAWHEDAGELRLTRTTGQVAAGRAQELWLIEGDNAPVSLGVLPAAAEAVFQVDPTLAARLKGGVLAISDEPPGGSPTGAPTGAVLAVGQVSEV